MSLNDRMQSGAWPFGFVEFPLLAKIAYLCRKQRPRNGTCDHPSSRAYRQCFVRPVPWRQLLTFTQGRARADSKQKCL